MTHYFIPLEHFHCKVCRHPPTHPPTLRTPISSQFASLSAIRRWSPSSIFNFVGVAGCPASSLPEASAGLFGEREGRSPPVLRGQTGDPPSICLASRRRSSHRSMAPLISTTATQLPLIKSTRSASSSSLSQALAPLSTACQSDATCSTALLGRPVAVNRRESLID